MCRWCACADGMYVLKLDETIVARRDHRLGNRGDRALLLVPLLRHPLLLRLQGATTLVLHLAG